LEEKDQVLPFKEIIRKFRKTKRIQANRERMEQAEIKETAKSDTLSDNIEPTTESSANDVILAVLIARIGFSN
jgi:hypothetical protein